MQLKELTKLIADDSGFSQTDTAKFLQSYQDVVTNALSKGEEVKLVGFMNLKVSTRPARKGRNPQTGKEIDIAESQIVRMSMGKGLKERVNGKALEKSDKKADASKKGDTTKKLALEKSKTK